jgi:hypothetical protein
MSVPLPRNYGGKKPDHQEGTEPCKQALVQGKQVTERSEVEDIETHEAGKSPNPAKQTPPCVHVRAPTAKDEFCLRKPQASFFGRETAPSPTRARCSASRRRIVRSASEQSEGSSVSMPQPSIVSAVCCSTIARSAALRPASAPRPSSSATCAAISSRFTRKAKTRVCPRPSPSGRATC